jgi:uncharacterized membrane protein YqhA
MKRVLVSSRLFILVAVIGALLASILELVFAAMVEGRAVFQAFQNLSVAGKDAKSLTIALIQTIDLFLLGAGFYLIAIGLYELFIDDSLELPDWLQVHDFDDLKAKLASIIVVVLSVAFLSQAVKWNGDGDLLGYGVAIAVVIAALTYFISVKGKKGKQPGTEKE